MRVQMRGSVIQTIGIYRFLRLSIEGANEGGRCRRRRRRSCR